MSFKASPIVVSASLWVPVTIDQVWTYFSDIKNFSEITPRLFLLEMTQHQNIEKGLRVSWRFNFSNIKVDLPLEVEFVEVQSEGPHRVLVDQMVKGPLRSWRHEHRFEQGLAVVDGTRTHIQAKPKNPGTWLYDHIECGGLRVKGFGQISDQVIARFLGEFLNYRYSRLREIFSALSTSTSLPRPSLNG